MAVVNQGVVLEKISFPFGGIFSTRPWPEVASGEWFDFRKADVRA
jgi:hypothetical protein